MMIGPSSAATSGNGSVMGAAGPGLVATYAGNTAGNVLITSSSIVSLSSPTSTRQAPADELGLYGPGTSSAVEMAQRLRQAADEKLHPKTGSMQNPMSDVMLMLLIAQAKAYLSSKAGSI